MENQSPTISPAELVLEGEGEPAKPITVQSRQLELLDQARTALVEARSLRDVKKIRDKVEAIRKYLRAQGESLEIQNYAAEIRIRAEHKAGCLLAEIPKAAGTRGQLKGKDSSGGDIVSPPEEINDTLSVLGIDKKQSSRLQSIASVPECVLEEHIESIKESSEELSSAGVLKIARDIKNADRPEKEPEPLTDLDVINMIRHAVWDAWLATPGELRQLVVPKFIDFARELGKTGDLSYGP